MLGLGAIPQPKVDSRRSEAHHQRHNEQPDQDHGEA
jgi:hypothetical protein